VGGHAALVNETPDGLATRFNRESSVLDRREWNLDDGTAPFYGSYRCADGRCISVGCIEPPYYSALARVLGLSADPVFAN
jgi:crotonobetainyl-CoA:carnitine CoA-transferase CaiB-like acyl-CoA transferase